MVENVKFVLKSTYEKDGIHRNLASNRKKEQISQQLIYKIYNNDILFNIINYYTYIIIVI